MMGRPKKPSVKPAKTDAELKLEEIRMRIRYLENKVYLLGQARAELEAANNPAFAPAIAYLQGMERAFTYAAREVGDILTGDDCPF